MGARKPKKAKSPDFERSLADLEEIVLLLEAGDQPLEESLASFEKGVALVRTLHERLDGVQTRIDELVQGGKGKPALSALDTGGDQAEDFDDQDEEEDDEDGE